MGKGANIRHRRTNSASRKDDMFVCHVYVVSPREHVFYVTVGITNAHSVAVALKFSSHVANATLESARRSHTETPGWATLKDTHHPASQRTMTSSFLESARVRLTG